MHYGRLDRDTAAARVLGVLMESGGEWVSGWDLTVESRTTAVSTRISEIRAQLGPDAVETRRNGRGFFYRVGRA